MLCYKHSFAQICLLVGTDSQVSDVAHGPLLWMHMVMNYVSHFRPDQHKIPDEVLTVCCEVSTRL